jgi:hypothetical protein
MTRFQNIIFMVLLSFTLMCCDPGITYKYDVQNNSDFKIQIEYFKFYMVDSIITIPPKSNIVIAEFPSRGSNPHDEGRNFLKEFTQIYYVPNDCFKIAKNLLIRENWKYDRDVRYLGIFKVGTNKYQLVIDNSDIKLINER